VKNTEAATFNKEREEQANEDMKQGCTRSLVLPQFTNKKHIWIRSVAARFSVRRVVQSSIRCCFMLIACIMFTV